MTEWVRQMFQLQDIQLPTPVVIWGEVGRMIGFMLSSPVNHVNENWPTNPGMK
jgi:hypothetical protein